MKDSRARQKQMTDISCGRLPRYAGCIAKGGSLKRREAIARPLTGPSYEGSYTKTNQDSRSSR